ncbi:hypothetical protein N7454_001190 [Penicillium verhagenii]|nr:hypothetical protein N7454_001190 [Penicillium verhagenii]
MDEFITNINQLNLSQTHLDLQDELDSIIRQEPAHATEDLVPIHPGMSRVSHTNIRSSSISSNSPAPTSSSSASTSTSNSSNPTEVSPSPPTFPPHILNILLNRLLTEPRYLTHPNLCHIRQIARTTDAAAAFVGNFLYNNRRFHRELETAFLGPYRDAQRGRRVPLNMLVPIFGWPNEEPDVITGAILDDCPGCFEWIRRRLPRMDCYGCNLFGWTYVAIAVHARSIGILEYLFRVGQARWSNGCRAAYAGECVPDV